MRGIFVLREWLDGRQPYAAGVELARAHGSPAQLLALLDQGENPFTKRKLRAELQRLADLVHVATTGPGAAAPRAAVAPAPLPATEHVHVHVATTEETPALQETPAQQQALAPLRAARLAGFKRASYLKARLELMDTDAERFEAACEIKQLWRENQKSWDDEGYYLEFGFFPPEAAPVPGLDRNDPAQVTRRRNTLRTYVSAGRGTVEKQAAWQAEMLELNRILENG